jgi:hypothetical protein
LIWTAKGWAIGWSRAGVWLVKDFVTTNGAFETRRQGDSFKLNKEDRWR